MLGVIGENVYAQVSNYPQTLDEAKEYLLQNRKIYIIKNGQTCEYEYEFQTEKDLDKAAEYIMENGLESFNTQLTQKMQNRVNAAIETNTISTRDADVLSKKVYIPKKDGVHRVSEIFTGIADFEGIDELIYTSNYIARISYNVTVKNGVMTDLTGYSFEMQNIDFASLKSVTLNKGLSNTGASVTANYTMERTISETILGVTINMYTVETTDWCCLLTYFE